MIHEHSLFEKGIFILVSTYIQKYSFTVFFSFTVLAKVSVNNSQIVVTCCYLTMVFTVNLFSNDQSLLMVFFSLILLAKKNRNICQVIVACCYVSMVFTVNLFSYNQSLLIVFFSLA